MFSITLQNFLTEPYFGMNMVLGGNFADFRKKAWQGKPYISILNLTTSQTSLWTISWRGQCPFMPNDIALYTITENLS